MADRDVNEGEECVDRRLSYIRFMSSLPRMCSPTVCGTANYETPDRSKWSATTPLDQSFNWSIEQQAVLDPMDFSNTDTDTDFYRRIDDQIISKRLDEENERFFSQEKIIPSPKTPVRAVDPRAYDETSDLSMASHCQSMASPQWQPSPTVRTPELSLMSTSGNNMSIDCFKTPNNISKSRQKKKLFVRERDDHYLMETVGNRCSEDSAFSTIDGQSLDILSPIYSPDWRNSSLSKRIAQMSPICSINPNYNNFIDLDFSFDIEESLDEN